MPNRNRTDRVWARRRKRRVPAQRACAGRVSDWTRWRVKRRSFELAHLPVPENFESAAVSVVALSAGRAGCVLVGLDGWIDGCEVRLCDPCARVRPSVPCPLCVPAPPSPPVSLNRKKTPGGAGTQRSRTLTTNPTQSCS